MAEKKKNEWAEKLAYAPKNGYERLSAEEEQAMHAYCEDYKDFLDHGKTERLCVEHCIELASARGFVPYEKGMALKTGDKVYYNNRGKAIMLAVIGEQDLSHGANIGADEGDPQFIINDLLPHLGREQGKKPLNEAIPSESLNLLVGGRPLAGEDCSDRFKLNVLKLLNEKYGIVEEDLISAELEVVPAGKARDIGFDRSFIASYGHDDRVCAYAELAGIFDAKSPKRTAVCIFADKEEIGSEGVSGMLSQAFDKFMADLCEAQGVALRDCLANSFCLSADVTAAYDPNFADVYDKRNAAFVNYGVGLCKYTGAGGKSGASDASAEVVGRVRKLLNDNGVFWQMAELGKTDAGGGGTVAKFMAQRNIDTLDAGVPVLSMHAPYETVAKLDCYMTYKTMRVIFEQN